MHVMFHSTYSEELCSINLVKQQLPIYGHNSTKPWGFTEYKQRTILSFDEKWPKLHKRAELAKNWGQIVLVMPKNPISTFYSTTLMDVIFFGSNLTSLGQLPVSPALGSSHIRPCLQSVVYMGLLLVIHNRYQNY